MPPERKAFRAVVHGRVQGVGFRYSALREARAPRPQRDRGEPARRQRRGDRGGRRGAGSRSCSRWLERGPPGRARELQVQVALAALFGSV